MLTKPCVATLTKLGPFKTVSTLATGDARPDGGVSGSEGKFVTLESRRPAPSGILAGFGAGKSSVKVTGSIKDGSGRTLRDVRAAADRRRRYRRRRLARQADERLAEHRGGHREVPVEVGARRGPGLGASALRAAAMECPKCSGRSAPMMRSSARGAEWSSRKRRSVPRTRRYRWRCAASCRSGR